MIASRPIYSCVLLSPRRSVQIQHQQTLLGPILKSGRLIGHSCKGLGTCGACLVWVKGPVSSITEREMMTLENKLASPDERLACLTAALGDIEVWAPSWGPKED